MGHRDFNRQWAGFTDDPRRQHGGFGPGGWSDWGGWGRGGWSPAGGAGRQGGHQGPPPWVAGLFGLMQPDQRRGPRVRRGDVRSAILSVLAETSEPVNGYQVIQQITDRSRGEWRPSPGSVYPTIQQLEDEGLVAADDERGRRSLTLTEEGRAYASERADELAAVWAPFERGERRGDGPQFADLKPEIGQVMSAVWQIVTSGSERQRRAAVEVLVETRRKLYGILADGDEAEPGEER